ALIPDLQKRAIHLAFALFLLFLIFPLRRRWMHRPLGLSGVVMAVLASGAALYLFFAREGLVQRRGILLEVPIEFAGFAFDFPLEIVIGLFGILVLLEATRRAVGIPMVIICLVFLVFAYFGRYMPDLIIHGGVSLKRLAGEYWLGAEAIFGIPIAVSTKFIFLFVLFGALLDKAGAGKYFLDLAFAAVGRYRGGPAKASILASGMTGAISGSSIANVVTTGTFTIPVMKKMGMPAIKAGAIEVAASTNGQLMPPIMGAAAFIMAEFIGIPYVDVVIAAAIPAVISYMALFYISHLEALKLGLVGIPRADLPHFFSSFVRGIHFLLPIAVLLYLLMVERSSTERSISYSIYTLILIMLVQGAGRSIKQGSGVWNGIKAAWVTIYRGMVAGGRNMIGVAVAIAAAGIIVGTVNSTGLAGRLINVIEVISGGSLIALLLLTALLALVLGMGLPTTANYLIVASLLAGVVVELGSAAGLVVPLIAVHLYVFYFGLMADSTPPVCLAAFAASAISKADAMKTGVQSFLYDIRTSLLPLVFIFNTELLLIGVESIWHGILVFVTALTAILCFGAITQGWMFTKLRIVERLLLIPIIVGLFRPDFVMNQVYPAFEPIDMAAFVAGDIVPDPGQTIRFHVVRQTPYGDRYKLFALETPESTPVQFMGPYGMALLQASDGRIVVDAVSFGRVAEQTGIAPDDIVTEIDLEKPGQPAKELVYPFAYLLLGLVILMQMPRIRRAREKESSASA
ncbi:MAG: TRAP transporter permease, partial [Alphaproteobacteria bacterium]|nr:TRAP transporter permease [Alphaproteobacteria bacterium]